MERKKMYKIVKNPDSSLQLDSDDSNELKHATSKYESKDLKKKVSDILNKNKENHGQCEKDDSNSQENNLQELDYDSINIDKSINYNPNDAQIDDNCSFDYHRSVYLTTNRFFDFIRARNILQNLKSPITLSFLFISFFLFLSFSFNSIASEKNMIKKNFLILKDQHEKLKSSFNKFSEQAKRETDILKINKTSVINHNTVPYKYGLLFKRTTGSILNILTENFELFYAIQGSSAEFTLQFNKKYKIKKFGIFYPKKDKVSSAMKDFKLIYGVQNSEQETKELKFMYSTPGKYQQFDLDIPSKIDKLLVIILNNHGNQKFTCIYKMYIFAEDE